MPSRYYVGDEEGRESQRESAHEGMAAILKDISGRRRRRGTRAFSHSLADSSLRLSSNVDVDLVSEG